MNNGPQNTDCIPIPLAELAEAKKYHTELDAVRQAIAVAETAIASSQSQ